MPVMMTLGQMAVAHEPLPAIIGQLVGMAAEQEPAPAALARHCAKPRSADRQMFLTGIVGKS